MTFLLWVLGFYVFSGLALYLYAVVKSWEQLGFWNWEITENYIGICDYPKWLMGWMYLVKKAINKIRGV